MGNNLSSEKREVPIEEKFRKAVKEGDVNNVKWIIISRINVGEDVIGLVNQKNGLEQTNLMVAAWHPHTGVVEALLQYNADTAATDKYGYNALHYAALKNKTTTATVQLLLNKMKLEDINHKNRYGLTPLDLCYEDNNSFLKQQLIDLIRQKGGKRARELEEAVVKRKGIFFSKALLKF